MNSRDYKLFRQGQYYHVYNRGNRKEEIFLDNEDYEYFLKRLLILLGKIPCPPRLHIKLLPLNSYVILCYCLMDNHFHFLIQQNSDLPITKLITKLTSSYSKYFNKKYKKIGNVFQDTFKCKRVDNDDYLKYLSAYIHNNPENPFEYKYSSLSEYLDNKETICDTGLILKYFQGSSDYEKFVKSYSYNSHQKINHLTFEE